MRNEWNVRRPLLVLAVLALAAATMLACNSATDDPDQSENMVKVTGFEPLGACVDIDGQMMDTNGDGTDEQVFVDVLNTAQLTSYLRGTASSSMNDVVFTEMEIRYDLDIGSPPPTRREGVQVTVPAGGTASVDITTVESKDIPVYFHGGEEGNIVITFRGKDVSGEPVVTTGRLPIYTRTVCEGQQ